MPPQRRSFARKRKSLLLLLAGAILVALAATIAYRAHGNVPPWIHTESDPISDKASFVDIEHAPDFQFSFYEGNALSTSRITQVTADGACTYHYSVRPSDSSLEEREAHFQLDAVTVTDLRRLLADIDYFQKKRSYSAGVFDGLQRTIKVKASGIEKEVYCDNYFPDFEERLRAFVTSRILNPHAKEIDAGPVTTRYGKP